MRAYFLRQKLYLNHLFYIINNLFQVVLINIRNARARHVILLFFVIEVFIGLCISRWSVAALKGGFYRLKVLKFTKKINL